MSEHKKHSRFLPHVSLHAAAADIFQWHLEFFELLKDHVVRHVVKEAIARRKDDVTELHVEGGAVSGFGARGGGVTRDEISHKWNRSVWVVTSVELSRSGATVPNVDDRSRPVGVKSASWLGSSLSSVSLLSKEASVLVWASSSGLLF